MFDWHSKSVYSDSRKPIIYIIKILLETFRKTCGSKRLSFDKCSFKSRKCVGEYSFERKKYVFFNRGWIRTGVHGTAVHGCITLSYIKKTMFCF